MQEIFEIGEGRILRGWVIARQPDGTLLMRETEQHRRQSSLGCLAFTIFWNGILVLLAAAGLGLLPGKWELEGYGPGLGGLRPLTPFALVGLYGIYHVCSTRFTRQEWIAGPNFMELRWGWTFLRRMKSRRYSDGELELGINPNHEDGVVSMLSFRCPGGWMNQGSLADVQRGEASLASLKELAELVTQTTGWPLTIKEDAPDTFPKKPSG